MTGLAIGSAHLRMLIDRGRASRKTPLLRPGWLFGRFPRDGTVAHSIQSGALSGIWSGQLDSNQRPAVPKTAALPGCAIPRSLENDVDTRLSLGRQGNRRPTSMPIKERMRYPVARLNAVFSRRASDHLENRFGGTARGDDLGR